MSRFYSVSEVARRMDVPPRTISDLFYARELRDDRCPIVGGRRLIPEDYVEEVRRALRNHATVSSTAVREGTCDECGFIRRLFPVPGTTRFICTACATGQRVVPEEDDE